MYSLRRKLYTNYTLNLAQNPTQRAFRTLHSERSKPYTASVQNPTQRAFKTLHCERSEPYTASVRETIHEAEHKPYILFLNTNLADGI